ncbi:hypothetical protein CapIbe_016783 [Capra ibex]
MCTGRRTLNQCGLHVETHFEQTRLRVPKVCLITETGMATLPGNEVFADDKGSQGNHPGSDPVSRMIPEEQMEKKRTFKMTAATTSP